MALIVGPAIGGILIATVGLAGAYAVDLVSFIASFTRCSRSRRCRRWVRSMPPGHGRHPRGPAIRPPQRAILGTFVIDLNAMIFGMPTSLFPVLALDVFETGPAGFGLMAAAPAVGAFLGAFFSGWVKAVRRTGRAILAAVVVLGPRDHRVRAGDRLVPAGARCSSRWPARRTCSRRSSARPSSNSRRRTSCAAGSRRSTSWS